MTYTYGVAIPTNGNSKYLREVLESLAGLPTPPQAVAINDQSCGTDVAGICEEYTERFPTLVRTTRTDPPGAASARNEAIAAIVDDVEWVCILDDDSVILQLPEIVSGASAIVGEYEGRVASTSSEPFALDGRTIWTHAIESATFLRASILRRGVLFDENLGTGGPTPWQSGEGTDLLYRFMQEGPIMYDPGYRVKGLDDGQEAFPISKHRRYARGTGYVLRRRAPLTQQLRALVGPLVRAVKGQRRLNLHVFLGRLEGLLGRTF